MSLKKQFRNLLGRKDDTGAEAGVNPLDVEYRNPYSQAPVDSRIDGGLPGTGTSSGRFGRGSGAGADAAGPGASAVDANRYESRDSSSQAVQPGQVRNAKDGLPDLGYLSLNEQTPTIRVVGGDEANQSSLPKIQGISSRGSKPGFDGTLKEPAIDREDEETPGMERPAFVTPQTSFQRERAEERQAEIPPRETTGEEAAKEEEPNIRTTNLPHEFENLAIGKEYTVPRKPVPRPVISPTSIISPTSLTSDVTPFSQTNATTRNYNNDYNSNSNSNSNSNRISHPRPSSASEALTSADSIHHALATIPKSTPSAAEIVERAQYDSAETEVHTRVAAPVVHETVTREITNIREEVITRDIHNYDIYHRVQPVIDVEVLPTRHFVQEEGTGQLVEVSAEQARDLPEVSASEFTTRS